jgi:hypothetical protein
VGARLFVSIDRSLNAFRFFRSAKSHASSGENISERWISGETQGHCKCATTRKEEVSVEKTDEGTCFASLRLSVLQ